MNYFSANLVFCRKAFHVSQSELSVIIGKGQSTVAGWENGVSEPNVETLLKISEFFAISVDDLIRTDFTSIDLHAFKKLVKDEEKLKTLEESLARNKYRNNKRNPRPYQFNNTISAVEEPDPTSLRSTLKMLKTIDGKIDELISLAKKKSTGTPRK